MEFQKSVDLGVAQTGHVFMRASLLIHDKWIDIDQLSQDPAVLNGGSEAGDFFTRRSRDPARAARLVKARQRLGQALESTHGKRGGLVALRMKAGLSQSELAKRINTQQPSVARWERNPSSMGFETMSAWAEALGLDIQDVFSSIKEQVQTQNKVEIYETT